MSTKTSKKAVNVRFETTVRQVEKTLRELNPEEEDNNDKFEDRDISEADSEDDGWDTDLETPSDGPPKERRSADITGKSLYLRMCRRLGIPPVSTILENIHTPEIALAHHGLGPNGGRALAKALAKSTTVEKLDLQENSLGEEGAECFAKMLLENCYIKWLNISGNMIGSFGARAIESVISQNRYLQWLDLSFNGFVDKDAKYISEGLRNNTTLKVLNLSHNSFCEVGGEDMGPRLAENRSVTHLNLSWNHLRLKGAIAICHAMGENTSIEVLDLSWNGFADEGAEAMGKALKKNNTLTELDLSHNRITQKGALGIAKGLQVNRTLRVLKIGFNPLGSSGSLALLKSMKANADSVLEELYLNEITVKKDFLDLLEEYVGSNPKVKIMFGVSPHDDRKKAREPNGYLDNDDNESGRKVKNELLTALKNFLVEKRLRAVDLFNCLDKDKTQTLTPDEMLKGLKKFNVPLNDGQLKRLIRILDKDGNGEIDYGEFAAVNDL